MKTEREKHGISQSKLAKRIGVSRATISRYESGDRTKIAAPIVSAIADALGIDYITLIESCSDIDFEFPENSRDPRRQTARVDRIYKLLLTLNDDGLEEAIRQIELLIQIPKYHRDMNEIEAEEWNEYVQSERFTEGW